MSRPDQNPAQFYIGPAHIPILIWAGPNPNSDLGWTNSAQIKILIWASPNQNPLINNDK